MGTTIADGFRFRTSSLEEVMQLLGQWRHRVRSDAECMAEEWLATESVKLIDQAIARNGDIPVAPLADIRAQWDKLRDNLKNRRREPQVDYDFTVCILPHAGQFYGIVYTEQQVWRTDWFTEDLVDPMPYWNGTDGPEDLSESEWEARGRLWDEIMPSGIPANHGLSADLHDLWFLTPGPDAVVAAQPSFERRLARTAHEEVILRKQRELYEARGGTNDDQMSALVRDYVAARKWATTPAGRAAIAAEEIRLRPLLPREVTHFMLLGWGPGAPPSAAPEARTP